MFTMDDSGSMGWDFLPDYVAYVGRRHLRTAATARSAADATSRRPAVRLRVQPVRSAGPQQPTTTASFYDPRPPRYRPGKKADGTDLPCEGSDTDAAAAPWTAVYINGFAGYPGANSRRRPIDLTTGYPDTVWCWKTGPDDRREADGRRQRIGVPPQRPRLQRASTVERQHDAGDRRRLQLPEQRRRHVRGHARSASSSTAFTVNGNPYYYTISQVQFCSAKDAAGWGTTPCVSQWDPTTYKYVRYGTGAATFDPQAFTRVDIKPAGFLVNGVAARQSQRPHVRAGDDEFRQLVCVLPDADPGR